MEGFYTTQFSSEIHTGLTKQYIHVLEIGNRLVLLREGPILLQLSTHGADANDLVAILVIVFLAPRTNSQSHVHASEPMV